MKNFISLFALFIFLLSCQQQPEYEHKSENFKLIKLADGVYACIHKIGGKAICNTGIVDNGKETLIFDTFLSPIVAEELIAIVQEAGLSPIKYVVNSHFHNDHIRGNQVFSEDVQIISTSKTTALINYWEPRDIAEEKEYATPRLAYYDSLANAYKGDSTDKIYKEIQMFKPYFEVLAISYKEIKTRLPNLFISNDTIIQGPSKEIHLITKGTGHTESDIILYLPKEKIVFTGDLVFNDCHPYMGQGNPEKWVEYLNFIKTLEIEYVIPGHGEIGNKEELDEMVGYIQTLDQLVTQMHKNKRPLEEVSQIQIPLKYHDYMFEPFFTSNLKFLYNRFNKEP
jgi:glyoxylase-like metal-dependent hydrolase (beta-lactamase superfamily II)